MNGTTLDTLELFEEFKRSFTEEQSQTLSKALKTHMKAWSNCQRIERLMLNR